MSVSRVLKYKLKKFIESNVIRDPAAIAEALGCGYTASIVEKAMAEVCPDDLPEDSWYRPSAPPTSPRDATIDDLIEYIKPVIKRDGIQALIEWNYYPSACGCMGPQRTEPLCPCGMRSAVQQHKDDLLKAITARQQLGIL